MFQGNTPLFTAESVNEELQICSNCCPPCSKHNYWTHQ